MTGPEVTAAVERAGRAIWEHDNGHTTWPPRDPLEIGPCEDAARAALAAALDVQEIARALFDLDNPDLGDEWRDMAWADMGGSERSEERVYYELHATALRAALIGEGS